MKKLLGLFFLASITISSFSQKVVSTQLILNGVKYDTLMSNAYISAGKLFIVRAGQLLQYNLPSGSGGETDTTSLSDRIDQKVDSITVNTDTTQLLYWIKGTSHPFYNINSIAQDTTDFEQVIDTTGQTGNKILVGKGKKITSTPYVLEDLANHRILINTNQVSDGGINNKLYVKGDAKITGNLTLSNLLTGTGGTDSILVTNNGLTKRVSYSSIVPNLQNVTTSGNQTGNDVLLQNPNLATSGSIAQAPPTLQFIGNYWNAGTSSSLTNKFRLIYNLDWSGAISVNSARVRMGQFVNGAYKSPGKYLHILEIRQKYGDVSAKDSGNSVDLFVSPYFAQPSLAPHYLADFGTEDASAIHTSKLKIDTAGKIYFDATNTASGTTGAQTINKPAGSVNFAAGATSLVVTNSLVTSSSDIHCQILSHDATATSTQVVVGSGSFTIYLNNAATAETKVSFHIYN